MEGFERDLNEKCYRTSFGPVRARADEKGEKGQRANLAKIKGPELPADACENKVQIGCERLYAICTFVCDLVCYLVTLFFCHLVT